ncbi:MAG: M20/M25/M40 family metallo-hydrolase [Lachnospiraceae bacterium]|nr:M20/M25/M40 family metallo-hydrolase [Lachnospiraceae bacterium]
MGNLTRYVKENHQLFLETLQELAQIPAPSFQEEKRRRYCQQWLDRFQIPYSTDQSGSLLIPYRIQEGSRNRLVIAHLDVVFDETVPMKLERDNDLWFCPGIGDNTVNAVLLLFLAKYLYETKPETACGLWLAADTCEEGLGNLAGCRQVMKTLEGRVDLVLGFDLYRDRIYTGCIGSVRYRITAKTKGGHSFLNFGRANAIEVLSRLIEKLYGWTTDGNTTYNVGMISGGTSVNTIPQDASMLFEYRSDDAQALKKGKAYLKKCLDEIHQEYLERAEAQEVTVVCETVGERPCAASVNQEAVQWLSETCQTIIQAKTGVKPLEAEASTDCNIPLSMGIPAVCAGFVRGGGAHTREEWIDVSTVDGALEAAIGCALALVQGQEDE